MSKKYRHVIRNLILGIFGCVLLFGAFVFLWIGNLELPDFKSFNDRKVASSTKIYDRTGQILLYDIHQDIKRTVIPYSDMGPTIKNATVAIEDDTFYQHSGVRISSTIRAILVDLLHGHLSQGGSTITQQVIKNTLLTPEKSFSRKLKEWLLSFKLEQVMSKDDILGIYLNEAPYGGNIYGVKEAAQTYFAKNPSDLDIAEAAYLASIPKAPTYYSPYGKNKDKLDERKNLVLDRMHTLGFINDQEYKTASEEVVNFNPQELTGIRAPHFVMFIRDYLTQKYGEDMVENGGLKVITTLDYDLEAKAEEIVKKRALENETAWNGSNQALVAIDPTTGQILTMAGSRDYFDTAIDGNYNIATAERQPGSSFKPFVYATAFKEGYTPETVLFDVPTEFQSSCDAYGKALPGHNQDNCYHPDNYDNKFVGPIILKNALAQSRNVPSVQLLYLAGVPNSIQTATEMGISSLKDQNTYGLTLVLGGGEVSLLEMTSAYGVFANAGIRNPYTGILSVEDNSGNVLETFTPHPQQVLDKNVALQISNILSDNDARTPLFGSHSFMYFPGVDVAAKTGTTNNNKDAWLLGYTPKISVGVWSGNNDNKPMKKGSSISGPAWNDFMTLAIQKFPSPDFEDPTPEANPDTLKPVLKGIWQGGEEYFIDTISGKLATDQTPRETKKGVTITNVHSILYWINKNDPRGAQPISPDSDSEFNHFETGVQNWWNQNRAFYPINSAANKPTTYDDVHTQQNIPLVTITSPVSGMLYNKNQTIPIQITYQGNFPIKRFDVFVNNVYVGSAKNQPFSFTVNPSTIPSIQDTNTVKVVVYDSIYNSTTVEQQFSVLP